MVKVMISEFANGRTQPVYKEVNKEEYNVSDSEFILDMKDPVAREALLVYAKMVEHENLSLSRSIVNKIRAINKELEPKKPFSFEPKSWEEGFQDWFTFLLMSCARAGKYGMDHPIGSAIMREIFRQPKVKAELKTAWKKIVIDEEETND